MPSFRHFALLYKEQGLCYSKRMSKNNEKTNVCRLLDGKKLAYVEHTYPPEEAVSAEEVAAYLGQNPAQVFKTLVTVGKSGQHYESAEKFEHIILSAGKRGYQVELSTEVLGKMIRFSYAALTE